MEHVINRTRFYMASLLAVALVCSLLVAPVSADSVPTPGGGWATDAPHTEINFTVTHFFTPVNGSFDDFEIKLDYNAEKPEKSTVEARIKVASINTGDEKRDNHLRSADWFEADNHPYITFKSTSVRKAGNNKLIASGPLTIKGQSHQVELPITLLGNQMIPENMQAMLGGTKNVASFQASTSIDRGDYGVGVGSWAGNMVVGGEIGIEILLEAHNR